MTPHEREVMQMALDALDYVGYVYTTEEENQEVEQAIEALRTALAQPEKECSRVECGGNNGCIDICWKKKPQRKEWVGLTDEERQEIYDCSTCNAIEALHAALAKTEGK